jgi:hypothetical protein
MVLHIATRCQLYRALLRDLADYGDGKLGVPHLC